MLSSIHRASIASISLASVSLVVLFAGCNDKPEAAKDGAKVDAPAASSSAAKAQAFKGPDPEKVGMACKRDSECPDSGGYRSSCQFKCQKPKDAAEGYCQLQSVSGVVGAGPCDGHKLSTSKIGGGTPDVKTPAMYFCDVDQGVYCDKKTHLCTAAKALGAACGDGSEDCGKDAVCDPGTKVCVAAAAIGASCKDVRCSSAGYCDSDKRVCVPRLANGEPCKESAACQSLSCSSGDKSTVCKASTEVACPL